MKWRLIMLAGAATLVAITLFLARESGRCYSSTTVGDSWPTTAASGLRRVQANGIDFAYVDAGAGSLVLLLHGYPETPAVWAKAIPALALAGYHVVAPYMRGYSPTSAPPDGDYSIRALGGDVLALIGALGYDRAVVIGHDWGASAAYAAAYRSPAMVSRIIAVSIPHPIALAGDPSVLWKASHFLEYQLPFMEWWLTTPQFCHVDGIYARWASGWRPPQAVLDSVKQSFRADHGFHNALGYYWSFFSSRGAELGDLTATSLISVPTLVIGGVNDGGIDISRYGKARQGFVGPYQFIPFEQSGHFPEVEQPDHFNDEVLKFLGRPAG